MLFTTRNVVAIFILVISLMFLWLFFSPAIKGSKGNAISFTIEYGMPFSEILDSFSEQGLLESRFRLKLAAFFLGVQNELKAGKYEVQGGISAYSLLRKLSKGQVVIESITIREGLQARQIASLLMKKLGVDSVAFMRSVNQPKMTNEVFSAARTLEGYLFPNTYRFPWGISPEKAVMKMVAEFKSQVNDSLRAIIRESTLSMNEILTLASIIEGEAVIDSERRVISAVYHNRLKRGMLLQADPTIQYLIEGGPRRLLNRDLKIDSPYNTYKFKGLPPGPINNPGLASIKAALNPADVSYLYFVANGDGSHTFSRTLREHNRAKARFDKLRRQLRRERRK